MTSSYAIQAANDNSFGNDYIAGGAGDDRSSASSATTSSRATARSTTARGGSCTGVGATWNTGGDYSYSVCPSIDGAGDGTDYIEGGGGNDVIFGNQGQDDIIGGSSNLFGLTAINAAAGRHRHHLRRLGHGDRARRRGRH